MKRVLRPARPAVLVFGVFSGFEDALERIRELVIRGYGPLHPLGESEAFPFPETRTYGPSMGPRLTRRFFVPEAPWPQEGLAQVKLETLGWEESLEETGRYPVSRPVNVDPGILNDCRVILASTKDHAHRLYRGEGIYEELTLVYTRGAYRPLPWTYPDFRTPTYHAFFEALRDDLLARWQSAP